MSRVTFEGKLIGETSSLVFDFLSVLPAGVTISSASVTASTYSGTDAAPSAILSGSPTISGSKVTQKVTVGVLGVTYLLLASATLSDGQVRQLSGFLCIVPDAE